MSAPYYQDDKVTLFHGRCENVPEWQAADVLVCDVPYGIDYKSGARRLTLAASIEGDKDTSVRDGILAAWGDKPALIFGTWRIPRPAATRQVLIWDTKGALGMGALDLPWKPAHQEIYVLGKGFKGRRSTDVLTIAPVQSLGYNGREHPHQKPLELMRSLLEKCPPGTIADPTAGSGSTLVAAKSMGIPSIGVESNEAYCELIAKRCAQEAFDLEGLTA